MVWSVPGPSETEWGVEREKEHLLPLPPQQRREKKNTSYCRNVTAWSGDRIGRLLPLPPQKKEEEKRANVETCADHNNNKTTQNC